MTRRERDIGRMRSAVQQAHESYMIRLAQLALNTAALIGGGWLLLAVFATGYNFY